MRISDWSSDVCSSDLSKSLKEKGMAVDAAMVERIARLARLRLEPGEPQHLETEINGILGRSEEHTSELQTLMRISYAVFCLKKKKTNKLSSLVLLCKIQHNIYTSSYHNDRYHD